MAQDKAPEAEAKTEAKPVEAPKEPKKKKRSIKLIFTALVLMLTMKFAFILAIFWMLPTIVAGYVDISKERTLYRCVFMCNLSGTLPFLADLLAGGNSPAAAQQLCGNAYAWFVVYACAGLGWLLKGWMPHAVRFFIRGVAKAKIARIHMIQNRLVEEWGPGIQKTE